MEQLLERMGLYELMSILFSGISIVLITITFFEPLQQLTTVYWEAENNWIMFATLVGCYWIGLMFHEIGFWFQTMLQQLYRSKQITKIKSHILPIAKQFIFPHSEHSSKELAKLHRPDTLPQGQFFSFCRYSIQSKATRAKTERFQSLAALCRSLSVYLYLVTIFLHFPKVEPYVLYAEIAPSITIIAAILLTIRWWRFIAIRKDLVYRSYYFETIAKKCSGC